MAVIAESSETQSLSSTIAYIFSLNLSSVGASSTYSAFHSRSQLWLLLSL
jgi:hypothetical protein